MARRELQGESHGGRDTSGMRRAKVVVAARKGREKATSTNGVASTAAEDTVQ